MINKKNRIITISKIKKNNNKKLAIYDAIEDLISRSIKIRRGDTIFIKPNLFMPYYIPGVCTSRLLLEVLCVILKEHDCKICIGEGDGGLASFSAMKAFAGNGLLHFKKSYNVNFFSLSTLPREKSVQFVAGHRVEFLLPKILVIREFDYLINVPVLKIHIITKVSLSMKNLWGCIPDPYRIHYHHMKWPGCQDQI